MSNEFLGDRRKSLEESFFAKQDAKLLERCARSARSSRAIAALASASQISDPELLEKLVDLGIDAASWTALSLVPLVEVAWADGAIEPQEREAILAAAAEHGVEPGSPGRALLESLLDHAAGARAVRGLGRLCDRARGQAQRRRARDAATRIVERARKVAQSAGGMLGIASISDAEKRVIAALEKPFA